MLRQKWNDEEFHKKTKDELKESGEWREEFDDKLKSELDRSNKIIEKLKFKNKSLLDDQDMKHLKQLKELEHGKLLDEWRDKVFFKDGQDSICYPVMAKWIKSFRNISWMTRLSNRVNPMNLKFLPVK